MTLHLDMDSGPSEVFESVGLCLSSVSKHCCFWSWLSSCWGSLQAALFTLPVGCVVLMPAQLWQYCPNLSWEDYSERKFTRSQFGSLICWAQVRALIMTWVMTACGSMFERGRHRLKQEAIETSITPVLPVTAHSFGS